MRMDIVDTPNENAQGSKYLTPQLTFLDKHYNNSTDFFSSIFLLLKEKGYVRDSFLDAILAREKAYPTGLPTLPVAIALPHTDPPSTSFVPLSLLRDCHNLSPGRKWGMTTIRSTFNLLFFLVLLTTAAT